MVFFKTETIRTIPADTRHRINVGLTLVQRRRRRWSSVKRTLIQRFVSVGIRSYICITADEVLFEHVDYEDVKYLYNNKNNNNNNNNNNIFI